MTGENVFEKFMDLLSFDDQIKLPGYDPRDYPKPSADNTWYFAVTYFDSDSILSSRLAGPSINHPLGRHQSRVLFSLEAISGAYL